MLAQDTAALLDGIGIKQAVIMGHSMGGFVAQALALSRPDLVHKLVLSATNFGGPRHIPITPEAMAVLTDTTSDPLTRLKRGILISCAPDFEQRQPVIVEEWLNYRAAHPIDLQGYQAQMGIGLALLAESASFENQLPEIQTPTLILFGEYDKVVPPGNAGLLAQQIPNSQVVILPGAGHFYPIETPEAASREVITFVTTG
jgi:pimeloyl-ACP methyl ester carboxylesterase